MRALCRQVSCSLAWVRFAPSRLAPVKFEN